MQLDVNESDHEASNEVFVGNLHQQVVEIDLMSVFSQIGRVKNTRIIRTHENTCRGYAFVVFENQSDVQKAINELQGFVLYSKPMILRNSIVNNVLFLVGIRRSWTQEFVESAITSTFLGVTRVSTVPDAKCTTKNRGFCFVRFMDHTTALNALNRINDASFVLGDSKTKVQANWADTQIDFEGDEGINKKALYVTPIDPDIGEEELKPLFEPFGAITHVALARNLPNVPRKNFAFINFNTEEEAANALIGSNNLNFHGERLHVSYAHRTERTRLNRQAIPESQICRYFLSSSGCRNGCNCRYSHQAMEGNYLTPTSPGSASSPSVVTPQSSLGAIALYSQPASPIADSPTTTASCAVSMSPRVRPHQQQSIPPSTPPSLSQPMRSVLQGYSYSPQMPIAQHDGTTSVPVTVTVASSSLSSAFPSQLSSDIPRLGMEFLTEGMHGLPPMSSSMAASSGGVGGFGYPRMSQGMAPAMAMPFAYSQPPPVPITPSPISPSTASYYYYEPQQNYYYDGYSMS